jgi:hypothetical protein
MKTDANLNNIVLNEIVLKNRYQLNERCEEVERINTRPMDV